MFALGAALLLPAPYSHATLSGKHSTTKLPRRVQQLIKQHKLLPHPERARLTLWFCVASALLCLPRAPQAAEHPLVNSRYYKKTVLVTGAGRGIGLALCKELKQQGATVIATTRKVSRGLKKLMNDSDGGRGQIKVIRGIDVGSDRATRQLRKKLPGALDGGTLDLVINVAGIVRPEATSGQAKNRDMLAEFQINALGPKRVLDAAQLHLRPGSKIAMISSQWGSISETLAGKVPRVSVGYQMSKAALDMFGVALSQQVKPLKVAVGMYNPGWVRTDMGGKNGELSPKQAAQTLLKNISTLTLRKTGQFWDVTNKRLAW